MAGEADFAGLPCDLGPLRLQRRLGAGGMGTVYEAVLASGCAGLPAGARVAAKVLRDDVVADADALKRLRREAMVGAALDHPAIVRTHGLIEAEEDGRPRHVLLMELVEGTTLRRLLDEMGALPEPMLRHVALQLARALEAVHAAGVVHRDVKPENVLVGATQQVKLGDLGIARRLQGTTDLTNTGAFLGSVAYASPEHFGAGALSPRSDLYSLGVVLHEAAAGRRPFEDATVAGLIRRHVEQRPRRLGELVAEISPFLEGLVAALLEKDPHARIPSAGRLADILTDGESSDWWRAHEGVEPLAQQRARVSRGPFVGRDADLERVDALAVAALRGEGGLILVEGEAGVGKSRLLDELRARIEERDERAVVLRGENPPGASGRGAVAESLAARFGESGLRRLLEANLASAESAAALTAWALGLPAPPGVLVTRELVHSGLARLVAAVTTERPIAWLVEDLHFAHAEERALVAALARAARERRMVVVATTRPNLPAEDVATLERLGGKRVPLARLSARAVVELLEAQLGSRRLAEDLGGRVASKTDGNPYFVLAVVRDLQERGAVARGADGSWSAVGRISLIEVPTSVKSLMLERAAALSAEERAAVDAAAVQGFHFDGDLVAEVLGLSRLSALQTLAAVERRTGLVRAHGARYQFDHHQLQEVLVDAIPAPLRSEYDALIARALASRPKASSDGELAARVSRHAIRGGLLDLAEEHVGPAFLHFRTRLQNEAAIELALLGRERFPEGSASRSLACTRLAYTYELLGRSSEALAMAEEAVRDAEAARDAKHGSQARHALVTVLSRGGRLEQAERIAREGREMARACGAASVEGKHVATLGTILAMSGRMDEAIACFHEAAARFAELQSPGDEAIALGNLSQALAGSGSPEALGIARRSLQLARDVGDVLQSVYAESNVALLLAEGGELGESIAMFAHVLDRTRVFAVARLESSAAERFASTLLAAGRIDEAEAIARSGLVRADETRDVRTRPRLLTHLAECARERGDVAEASALLARAVEAADAVGVAVDSRWARLRQAALALVAGDRAVARDRVSEAAAMAGAPENALIASWRCALLGEKAPSLGEIERLPFDVRCEALALCGRVGELASLESRVAERLAVSEREAFSRSAAPARARDLAARVDSIN